MQATTGCKINVSPASGQDFERDIGLVGSRDSIEQAKRTIMEKVHAVVGSGVRIKYRALLMLSQQEKNRPAGGGHRDNDRDDLQHMQQIPQSQPARGQQNPQPQAGGDADPYAPYGGYENYVALWYSSYQQQAQQNPQSQGPPGS